MLASVSSSLPAVSQGQPQVEPTRGNGNAKAADGSGASAQATPQLTAEQQRTVARLQQIDRAVRAHEQAHLSAGRDVVTSGAQYDYTYGPDGKRYAVGGEVGIDTSAEQKPEANIEKGRRIQAAALAPANPSPQDYRVAAIGSQLESKGWAELDKSPSSPGETREALLARAYTPPRNDDRALSVYA